VRDRGHTDAPGPVSNDVLRIHGWRQLLAKCRLRSRVASGSLAACLRIQVAGFLKLTVNLLLNPVNSNAHEARLSIPGIDRFADLEPPFPPVLVNLHKGKFNAFAVHLQPLDSSRYAMVLRGWSSTGR
jgi:hypothetical protein